MCDRVYSYFSKFNGSASISQVRLLARKGIDNVIPIPVHTVATTMAAYFSHFHQSSVSMLAGPKFSSEVEALAAPPLSK